MRYILLICGSLTVFDKFSVSVVLSVLDVLGGMGEYFGLPQVTTLPLFWWEQSQRKPTQITTL
jgi:hypothetical protein